MGQAMFTTFSNNIAYKFDPPYQQTDNVHTTYMLVTKKNRNYYLTIISYLVSQILSHQNA